MYRTIAIGIATLTLAGCTGQDAPTAASNAASNAAASTAGAEDAGATASVAGGRRRSGGVVYVTSQDLYFDTFVAVDPLPNEGPFQLLVDGETQYGPGDPGYLGGRWWEDLNGNGVRDDGDHFFLCPLLPPGRPTP